VNLSRATVRPAKAIDDTNRPKLRVEYRDPVRLTPNPANPRRHSAQQIQQIARSIETFGFLTPLLIDDAGCVIAGHGRLLAAQTLGLTRIPVIPVAYLTAAQKRAYLIADNKIALNSEWDEALLAAQFAALSEVELDFALEVTGFEIPEIDLLLQGDAAPATKADPDDAVSEGGPPVSVVGDIWQLGDHRIACGSALDPVLYARLLGSERVALVFADPPYNVKIDGHATGLGRVRHREFVQGSGEMNRAAFTEFLRTAFSLMTRHSTDGALHYVCMDWRHSGELLNAAEDIYAETKNCCVWDKGNAGMGSLYRSQHELVWVFKTGKGSHTNNVQLGRFGRHRSNVWSYPGIHAWGRAREDDDVADLHPTVKPVALVADALLDASLRGDRVLDPFLGSGTTVIAAERTGRIAYGIELDPIYVDVAVRRWQRMTQCAAVHATHRCTFDELADGRRVAHG
jgi:DNA modification methylase